MIDWLFVKADPSLALRAGKLLVVGTNNPSIFPNNLVGSTKRIMPETNRRSQTECRMFILSLSTTFVCCFLIGAVAGLWERIPWILSQRSKIDEATCRRWQLWFSLPLVALFPGLGLLIESGKGVLFGGILALAVSLAWLGQHRGLRSGLLAVLLLCLAVPCIALPTLTVLLPATFRAFQISSVAVLNLAFVGVCLGTLASPWLIGASIRRFDSRHGFLVLALACLVPALFVIMTSTDYFESPLHGNLNTASTTKVFEDPLVWILAGLAFLYFPLEGLLGAWRRNFLQQSENASRLAPFGFWLAFLVARLGIGWFINDQYAAWVLVGLALTHAVLLGNLASEFSQRAGALGLWAAGASFAPLLPTLLALALALFPKNPAAVMGIMFGFGYLGNFLSQPMLERFAENRPVSATMRLAMFMTLAWMALVLVLALVLPEGPVSKRPTFKSLFKHLFKRVGKKPLACIIPLWNQKEELLPLSAWAVPRILSTRSECWAFSPRTATRSFPRRKEQTSLSSIPVASLNRQGKNPWASSAICFPSRREARWAPSSWPAAWRSENKTHC